MGDNRTNKIIVLINETTDPNKKLFKKSYITYFFNFDNNKVVGTIYGRNYTSYHKTKTKCQMKKYLLGEGVSLEEINQYQILNPTIFFTKGVKQ